MKAKQGSRLGEREVHRKLYYIPFLIICAALLIFASFRDLQIDKFLNNTNSNFGNMLAEIGELPVYCVVPFGTMVLFGAMEKERKAYLLKKIIAAVGNFLGWGVFYLAHIGPNLFGDVEDRNETFFYVLFAALAVICCVLSLHLASRVPQETMKKLKPFAIMIMFAALGTALTTELIKNLVGRVRFRDLVKNGGDSAFTNWYIINGFGSKNKSFPSGHTSAAAASMAIMALPDVFKKLKKYEIDLFVVGAIYTLLVGFSRMIVGAHYLSDITVGALIGFCWIIVLRKFYLDKKTAE